jgi:hypothetical protein
MAFKRPQGQRWREINAARIQKAERDGDDVS